MNLRRFFHMIGVAHSTVFQPPALVLIWRAHHSHPQPARNEEPIPEQPTRRSMNEGGHKS